MFLHSILFSNTVTHVIKKMKVNRGGMERENGGPGRGGDMFLREADWGGGASIIEGGLVYWCGLRRECTVESR